MSLPFALAFELSVVRLATPVWADFQAGVDAADRGDWGTASGLRAGAAVVRKGCGTGECGRPDFPRSPIRTRLGVPQDFVQAHKWYNLAGAKGDKKGAALRDTLATQ